MEYNKQLKIRSIVLKTFFLLTCALAYSQQKSLKSDQKTTLQQYMDVGNELQKKENYVSSISYFLKATKIAKEIEDKELLSKAYMKLGNSYYYSWKNEKAIEAYYNALAIAKENKNIDQELIAYSGLIAFLPVINKQDKAVDFSIYALSLIDKASFKGEKNHVRVLTTICDAYMAQGNYKAMYPHIEKGIEIADTLRFQEGLVDLHIKKGKFYRHQKNYDKAFECLFYAKKIIDQNDLENPFFPTVNTNYAIGECFYDQQKYNEAITHLSNSIPIIKEGDLEKDNVIKTYDLLAQCHIKKENYKKATSLLNKVITITNTASRKKNIATNKFHDQDSEKFLNQIIALQNKGKEDRQTMSYMFWTIIVATSAFMITLLLYVKKQKANRATFQDLLKKISALEEEEKVALQKPPKKESKNILVDDSTIKVIIGRLDKLEAQKYFLKSNCTQASIAKKTKTNVTYLSQIIRSEKGKSFSEYINDLRIEYVLKRLKNDKKFRSFSIKGIATELGYKTDDSFVKHFKKKTGLNPSYYIKELNKMKSDES
ncbi:tetratricopeptide repeat protein [Kordia sp.]|uniref:tetratricopeptide repeat protein n=1 Tax=Kordia sp. TaxID=1965332 RepID=UPI0025BFBBD8|nr:tetratricopeptide repeat protein [Kordia sp.]MCH2192613.1 tetratricopeptide repeat protein [Kordia sp.]